MKLVEEVKKNSSKWIITKGKQYQTFYWQGGYAAFSVNPADMDGLIQYIQNQEHHHKDKVAKKSIKRF